MENNLPQNSQPQFNSGIPVSTPSNSNTSKLAIVGLLVLLPVVGVSGYYFGKQSSSTSLISDNGNKKVVEVPVASMEPAEGNQVACTMDARLCPDGSSVGRTGPNCEFAECPITENVPKDWKKIENTNLRFSFSYPVDLVVFNLKRTAGKQQVLYELSRSNQESAGDYSTGVYLISYYPKTTVETLFTEFSDGVNVPSKTVQISSKGLTIQIRREIPDDGPGAGIETMLAAVELNGGVLTFDLISNGPSRDQDAKVLESVLKTLEVR